MSNTERHELSRRQLLLNGVRAIGALIAVSIATPVVGSYITPALKKEESRWVDIASIGEIPTGEPKAVQYTRFRKDGWTLVESQESVWVLTNDGKTFTVYNPRCTHLGCPYSWEKDKQRFYCPCHGGVFDINGNVVAGPPPRPLDRYENKVDNRRLLIGRLIMGGEGQA